MKERKNSKGKIRIGILLFLKSGIFRTLLGFVQRWQLYDINRAFFHKVAWFFHIKILNVGRPLGRFKRNKIWTYILPSGLIEYIIILQAAHAARIANKKV